MRGLHCCEGSSLAAVTGATPVAVPGLLLAAAPLAVHGPQVHGLQQFQLLGSGVQLLHGTWNLPGTGIDPCTGQSYPLCHQGSPGPATGHDHRSLHVIQLFRNML